MKCRIGRGSASEAIRARLGELRAIWRSYRLYQRHRIKERDHHGAWDVAVNLSETEAEMAGLKFALRALTSPRASRR